MNTRHSIAAVAAALAISAAAAQAGNVPSSDTDPGFNPQSGQINPGDAPHPWSATATLPQDKRPSQEQARAALLMPDPVGVSSPGEGAPAQSGNQGGNQATTGAASSPAASGTPTGPIGSTLQTVPAKFSERNDLLDHVPVMSWPLRLDEQQRKQIYQAVMADKSQPAADADALEPATFLTFAQTRDVRPLPPSVSGIDGLGGLACIKTKNKVLLVRPPTGIVVDQITM